MPDAAPKIRLRRSDLGGPGLTRRRRGKGWEYRDADGHRVDDPEVKARIDALAIPPAWKDVWICPYPGGHIQATGIDERGRKQYRYHQRWRERRDQEKFDEMLRFARVLPDLRERVDTDLARTGMPRERALACAVRLLDLGFFRIGSEDYAVENETYGLATMRKAHARVDGERITFDYRAKSGKRQVRWVVDPAAAEVVATLKRRRGGSSELLAFKRAGRWTDVKSGDINAYIKEATGGDFSAKAFRTWGATLLAAVALGVSALHATQAARKRVVLRAVKEVAHYLGNTPAVARASYIDPRLFDRFEDGVSIAPAVLELAGEIADPEVRRRLEAAVVELLEDDESSPLVGEPQDLLAAAA